MLFYETVRRQEAPAQRAGKDAPSVSASSASPLVAELLPIAEARRIEAPWRRLCGELLEQNPFFEPWSLIPALDHFADPTVRLACVWDSDAKARLLGFAPIIPQKNYAHLPARYWSVFSHPHCYYAAPLLHRAYGEAVFEKLFALFCDGEDALSFMRLPRLCPHGPAAVAAITAAQSFKRAHYRTGNYQRATLYSGPTADEYLARQIRKKKQKELNRLRNRLEDIGTVSFRRLMNGAEMAEWIETFLALEDKGWKGEGGTSLKSSPADAAWFRKSVLGAFSAEKLDFLRLDCGAETLAMLVSLGGAEGYSLKICHHPDYAKYSPGVMIEIEATKSRLNDPSFSFLDSCAAPDHPMINSLWRGRRDIGALIVSGLGLPSKSVVATAQRLEQLRAKLSRLIDGGRR